MKTRVDDNEAPVLVDDMDAPGTTDAPSPPRVLIADDDPFVRRMVKNALRRAGLVVIAEARNGLEAVELVRRHRPDVVLMDLVMPELDGIAATRRILSENSDQVVVILTSTDDDEAGLLGLRSGAVGFLTKDLDVEALPRALRGLANGEAAISRRLEMRLVQHLRNTAPAAPMRGQNSPLTPREWDVIDLLAQSMTTDQMAATLVVSSETVRSHVKNILRKLGASSREEALAIVERMRVDAE